MAELARGPGAAEGHGRVAGEPTEPGGLGLEQRRVGARDYDERRVARVRGFLQRLGWSVRAEEQDPPAVRAEREPERQQADVVLFAGCAREQRERPRAAAPEAGQREQAPADQVAREVLLRNVERAALPAVADLDERWKDQVADRGLEPVGGQAVVEHRLDTVLVVETDCRQQTPSGLCEQLNLLWLLALSQRDTRRLGRRQAVVECPPHARDPVGIFVRVQPIAAGRADGGEQAVALLPGPEQLGADADAARELADAVRAGHGVRHYTDIRQTLDNEVAEPLGCMHNVCLMIVEGSGDVAHYRASIETQRSQDEVFAYLSDFSNTAEWDPGIAAAEKTTPGEIRPTTEFRVVARVMGREAPFTYRVVEYDAPRSIALIGESSMIVSRDRMKVEQTDAGARLTYEADLTLKGILRLADPLLAIGFKRVGDRALGGLKRTLSAPRALA